MILSPPPLHGYSAAQEAAWDEAVQRDLRTPDDGQPLTVMDWLHLNLLGRHTFHSPHNDDWLWEWRVFAGTPLQHVCLRRLVAHELLMVCDDKRAYCRLSARGLRKVAAVWQHLEATVNESKDTAAPRMVL